MSTLTFDANTEFAPGILNLGEVFPTVYTDMTSLERARLLVSDQAQERFGKELSHVYVDFSGAAAERGVQVNSPVYALRNELGFGTFPGGDLLSEEPIAYMHKDGGVEHLIGTLGGAASSSGEFKYKCELFVPNHGIIRYSHPVENEKVREMFGLSPQKRVKASDGMGE